jgi:signal transduction histidine kinase
MTPLALPSWLVAFFYLAAYVSLDFVSYIFPLSPVGITPWNPQTGLSFALVLLKGRTYVPLLFVAPALSSLLVHRLPAPIWMDGLTAAVLGCGYAAATLFLLRPKVRFDPTLSSLSHLATLLAVAGVSSALVAIAFSLVFVLAGWLSWAQYPSAVLHYWVGDAIGVFVVTPFLLCFATGARLPKAPVEMTFLLGAILLALWVIFGFDRAWEFQFFYLLFLPVVWIAARFGLEGASAGLFATQAGLVMAMDWSDQSVADVAKFQLLMLVLALTGLLLGVAISEQRRGLTRLRIHQEALARASRLTSLSALATALAHEVNQPLTAIGNYVRLLRDMVKSGEGDTAVALATSEKAVGQVDHAARLVRHFRELVRTGRGEVLPTAPGLLIAETLQLARPLLENANIHVDVTLQNGAGAVLVDRLQIEQVLLNIITNSVEAIASTGRVSGRIDIEVITSAEPGFVEFRLSDDGPGFASELASGLPTGFATTKPEGMGLGLILSRSITEWHGGRLMLGNQAHGARLTVCLPVAPET